MFNMNNKTKRIVSTVIILILVLAMVGSMVIAALI